MYSNKQLAISPVSLKSFPLLFWREELKTRLKINTRFLLVSVCIFSALFICNGPLCAQDTTVVLTKDSIEVNVQQKGQYAFILYAGGGWFSYVGSIGSAGVVNNTDITRSHPIGTFRIMWHPDHRLRIGIETGYTNFYTYRVQNGNTTGKVNLTGIPILVVWSMALTKRFNVFAGIGSYLLTTNLDYKGSVKSKAVSLGINASVNYVQPISPKLGIGAELKWMDAAQTRDYGVSAQVMLVWKFFEW
ncbi:MAG: hypothetical protein ABIQ88_15030 [Chitinophagaceae bacterium]